MEKAGKRSVLTPRSSLVRDDSTSIYSVERDCLMECCLAVQTVRALTVWIIAKGEAWDEYLALSPCDPESPTFADDYLVTKMLSKNPLLRTTADPLGKAKRTWYAAEEQCRQTNELFRALENCSALPVEPIYATYLDKMRAEIARILGPLSHSDVAYAGDKMRFGPGSTSSVKGDMVLPSQKYVARFDATPRLAPFVPVIAPRSGGEDDKVPTLVLGNKAAFVPKTALTHRAIAIEPHANVYFQLGVGALLRAKLRSSGIDLDTQADRNRALVRVAHKENLATIDLASASDTVSYGLVAHVLPIDWLHLLDLGRSDVTAIDGKWTKLEKFSSMGNGYTFELETLLFLAACRATGAASVDVFGDDIIISRESAHKAVSFLRFLGFIPNEEKTFLAGMFFESCGVDVLRGADVRPFFLKGRYESVTLARIRIANAIRLYAHRRNVSYGCDKRFFKPWIRSFECDPVAKKTAIPVAAGSNGIIRNFDEASPSRHRCWDGYIATQVGAIPPVSPRTSQSGALVYTLHKPGVSTDYTVRSPKVDAQAPTRGREYVRGGRPTFRLSTFFVYEWVELGPWC